MRLTTSEDELLNITFSGSDIDGDELTFEVDQYPEHGSIIGNVYSPDANYNGTDLFTYIAFD